METPHQPMASQTNVTSWESLANSINEDDKVYKWFFLLVTTPSIVMRLAKHKEYAPLQQKLRNTYLLKTLLNIFFLILLMFNLIDHQPLLLLANLFLLWPIAILLNNNKDYVIKISRLIILLDFTEQSLKNTTLYQLSEFYHKSYSIISLVDSLYALDQIGKLLFFVIFFISYIYPMKTLPFIAFLFVAFYLTRYVLRMGIFYKNLGKINW